jgi:molybdate transport system ATP-binding protein
VLAAAVETRLRDLELAVELEIGTGRCLALAGPSGAGKTSFLRAVAGLMRPERGRVECGGGIWLDTERGIDVPPEARGCGYLFQQYALFPHLSAWRNVAFGLRDGDRASRRRRALELLERFGIPGLADVRPAELSGGERQRVALARALAREPTALLLDEPLAALDATTRSAAMRELAAVIAAAEVPTLLVTHEFAEASLLADEIAIVDGGRIVQRGTATALSAEPASAFVADFAGASVLLGFAAPGPDGLTVVELEGGGRVTSTDLLHGSVAVAAYPWEIALEPVGTAAESSALNHLRATVTSVTVIGNRARVGLAAPQQFAAEVTGASLARLGLEPGTTVTATFKATATRLIPRSARAA